MTVPRARRTTSAPDGTAKDVNPATKIVIPEGTKGIITEHQEGRTIQFEAELEQDEIPKIEDEGINFDDEADNRYQDQTTFQEIPKDPMTIMFDAVREVQLSPDEIFIANILRRADYMNDNFYTSCNADQSFPPLQFSSRDMFSFIPMIQKHNNNSGGRFTVSIYRQDATPLLIKRQNSRDGYWESKQVGLTMLVIPNPTKEMLATENGNNGNSGIAQVLAEMNRQAEERDNRIIEMLNRKPEKSTLEQAIEQKVLNDIMNPPQPQTNGNLEQTMATMFMMPAMVEGFARKMFPEPVAPHEPTTMDTVKEVLSLPIVDGALGGLMQMIERAQIAKMQSVSPNGITNPAETDPVTEYYEQPEPIGLTQADTDMQDLISDVVEELTGDVALNADNETIKELSAEYPEQFTMLKDACVTISFDNILAMLMNKAARMQPNPFTPFIDWNKTAETNEYVWNEGGKKLKGRLEELYNYLKTS